MARLPQPGADEGVWGDVLNEYLQVSHASDGSIKSGAVDASSLQDDSVTNAKLSTSNSPTDGQVLSYNGTELEWANAGVGGDPAMGGDLSGVASNAQIVAGAVGATELASNAVTTVKITDSNVTTAKIADSNVTTAKIADSNVTTAKIADSNVTTAKIADSNVTNAKIATGVAQSKITNLTTDLAQRVTTINGGGETYFDAGNSGASKTLDLANGNVQKLTLTANCTITLTAPSTGAYRSLLIYVFQDGTGSRTITWPGSVAWGTAGAPTLTTTASKMDKILLDTVDGGTTWYGTAGPGGF